VVKNVTKASTATAHKVSVCVLLASSHFRTQTATLRAAHVAGVKLEMIVHDSILKF